MTESTVAETEAETLLSQLLETYNWSFSCSTTLLTDVFIVKHEVSAVAFHIHLLKKKRSSELNWMYLQDY